MTPERWARLKDVFDRAVALEKPQRSHFVQEACAGDGTLVRSVVALLNHHETSGTESDRLAGLGLELDAIIADGLSTFTPGAIVTGRFRIERFLAEGGMGEVYAAEDLELNETVALKTIRPILAIQDGILTRFKKEIQLARKVTHRNVSRVFDLFRHWSDEGERQSIVFVSMELLLGETLHQRIRSGGPLSFDVALPLALQLVEGLEAAHAVGIVHRDFKSSNVALVAESDSDGTITERAVIMDFGLAATLRDPMGLDVLTGSRAGTPAYMAPEQVAEAPITRATDIYSLGIVLFEMVTGTVPYRGDSPLATAQMRLHRTAPSLRSVVPGAPIAWERTIRACLERDPAARPQSPREIAARLTGRYERRRRLRVLSSIVIGAAIAGGGWYWSQLPHRPTTAAQAALDGARVRRENVTRDGYVAAIAGLRNAIELDPRWSEAWAELAYTYAAGANAMQLAQATAAVEARSAAREAILLDDRSAKAYGALGWVQSLDLDEWPQAEANLRRAVRLDPDDAQLRYWLGVHLRKKGQFAEAEVEDRRAIALSSQRDPSFWCELAFLYWTSGRLDRMSELMEDLLVAHPNYGFTRFLNARLLKEQGSFDGALEELRISQTLQFSAVTLTVERASIEAYRGNLAAAEALLQELTELSKTHPVDSLLIAGVHAKLGNANAAFEWLEAGYALRDNTLLSLATTPVLIPLHGDARFQRLLQRLHFSEVSGQ